MALKIYGSARSRALRVLWMAAELGLEFEHIPVEWDDPALKQPGFLAVNPAGRIPAIDDDGFRLAESQAINLYLARKHRSTLYPGTLRDEARVIQWALWAQFDLEAPLDVLRQHRVLLPLPDRQPAAAADAQQRLETGLSILGRVLAGTDWLVGEAFGVADLNMACVLSPSRTELTDLEAWPAISGWLERCRDRPAWRAARRTLSAAG